MERIFIDWFRPLVPLVSLAQCPMWSKRKVLSCVSYSIIGVNKWAIWGNAMRSASNSEKKKIASLINCWAMKIRISSCWLFLPRRLIHIRMMMMKKRTHILMRELYNVRLASPLSHCWFWYSTVIRVFVIWLDAISSECTIVVVPKIDCVFSYIWDNNKRKKMSTQMPEPAEGFCNYALSLDAARLQGYRVERRLKSPRPV